MSLAHIVAAGIVGLVSILGFAFYNNRPSEHFNSVPSYPPPERPREKKDLNSICPICMLDLNMHARTLPCGHRLHNACFVELVRVMNLCPLCRQAFQR